MFCCICVFLCHLALLFYSSLFIFIALFSFIYLYFFIIWVFKLALQTLASHLKIFFRIYSILFSPFPFLSIFFMFFFYIFLAVQIEFTLYTGRKDKTKAFREPNLFKLYRKFFLENAVILIYVPFILKTSTYLKKRQEMNVASSKHKLESYNRYFTVLHIHLLLNFRLNSVLEKSRAD